MEHRIRPLKSIKTKEEYDDYKKHLGRYLSEYKLFQTHSDKYYEMIAGRNDLEPRERLIKNGEYIIALERNIAAYMITIDEYEAKCENRSLFDVIRGMISKDEDTREYLKRRYMKSRAEGNGLLEPVDLSLQDPVDSVKQIFEEYDFINISKPETSLVPVDTQVNKIFAEVREMLTECLIENGIDVSNNPFKASESISDKKAQTHMQADNKSSDIKKWKIEEKPKDEIGDEI